MKKPEQKFESAADVMFCKTTDNVILLALIAWAIAFALVGFGVV